MEESEKRKYYNLKKWETIVLVGLVVLAFCAPFLFTQFSIGPSFENTGEIGDTIGGLTAPFINLAAAFLVFKSFTAQIRANIYQQQNHDEQIKEIRKEQFLSSLQYLFEDIEKTIKKEEEKYSSGCVHRIFYIIDLFNNGDENSFSHHYEFSESIDETNSAVRPIFLSLNANLSHLLRLTTLVRKYKLSHENDSEVALIAKYFAQKVNNYLIDFRFVDLTTPEFISEIVNFNLNNLNLALYEEAKSQLSDVQYEVKQIL